MKKKEDKRKEIDFLAPDLGRVQELSCHGYEKLRVGSRISRLRQSGAQRGRPILGVVKNNLGGEASEGTPAAQVS